MIEATYRELCCSEAALFSMSRPPPDFPITATSVRDPLHVLHDRCTFQILICFRPGDLLFSDLRVALPVLNPIVQANIVRQLETSGTLVCPWLPPNTARLVSATT